MKNYIKSVMITSLIMSVIIVFGTKWIVVNYGTETNENKFEVPIENVMTLEDRENLKQYIDKMRPEVYNKSTCEGLNK